MYSQPSIPPATYPMPNHYIHGNLIEVTVVCCNNLRDIEWISRPDPYVCVEYGSNRSRTRVCTDGGKNPTFQEKFVCSLIEGLRELKIIVWNSNTLTHDDFIGSGKVQLAKVLSDGFDDSSWPLETKTGRHAGEVRLIMHYSNANNPASSYAPSAPPYVAPSAPPASMYSAQPPASVALYLPVGSYSYPPQTTPYLPNSEAYPPSAYPPETTTYPPQPYPPTSAAYHPQQPYASLYPPGSTYPGGYHPPY